MANVVEILINATDNGLEKTLDSAKESAGGLGEKLGGLGPMVTGLVAAAIPLAGAFALKDAVGDFEALGTSVSKLMSVTGDSAPQASRLLFAMQEGLKSVGASADGAQTDIQRFSKSLEASNQSIDAGKPDKLAQQLKDLGISIQGANGQLLPTDKLLENVADRFQTMPDGAEKTALAMQLFGKQGAALIPFLDQGAKGIAALEAESDKLGHTLSGPELEAFQKNRDASKEFDAAMEGVKIQLGAALMPLLAQGAELGAKLAEAFNEKVVPMLQGLGPMISKVSDFFQVLFTTLNNHEFAAALGFIVTTLQDLGKNILAEVEKWGQAFVGWVEPYIPKILEALGLLSTGIIGWIVAATVKYHEQILQWGQAFVGWVEPHIAPAIAELEKLGAAVIVWIGGELAKFLPEVAKWGEAFWQWVSTTTPKLLTELGKLVDQAIAWLGGNGPNRLGAELQKWGHEFIAWVEPVIPPLLLELGKLLIGATIWVGTKVPEIVAALLFWGVEFTAWVAPRIPLLLLELGKLLIELTGWAINTAVGAIVSAMEAVGEAVINGIKLGIDNAWSGLIGWIGGKLGDLPQAFKTFLHISSPSQLMADEVGVPIIQGIVKGMDDEMPVAVSAMRGIGASMVNATAQALTAAQPAINDALSNSIYVPMGNIAQPTSAGESVGKSFTGAVAQGVSDGAAPVMSAVNALWAAVQKASAAGGGGLGQFAMGGGNFSPSMGPGGSGGVGDALDAGATFNQAGGGSGGSGGQFAIFDANNPNNPLGSGGGGGGGLGGGVSYGGGGGGGGGGVGGILAAGGLVTEPMGLFNLASGQYWGTMAENGPEWVVPTAGGGSGATSGLPSGAMSGMPASSPSNPIYVHIVNVADLSAATAQGLTNGTKTLAYAPGLTAGR